MYIYIFPIGYSLLAIPYWLFPIGYSYAYSHLPMRMQWAAPMPRPHVRRPRGRRPRGRELADRLLTLVEVVWKSIFIKKSRIMKF